MRKCRWLLLSLALLLTAALAAGCGNKPSGAAEGRSKRGR